MPSHAFYRSASLALAIWAFAACGSGASASPDAVAMGGTTNEGSTFDAGLTDTKLPAGTVLDANVPKDSGADSVPRADATVRDSNAVPDTAASTGKEDASPPDGNGIRAVGNDSRDTISRDTTGSSETSPAADAGCAAGPIGTLSGPLATGIVFLDEKGERVNAHGGGIIRVGSTFYMHGEYFPPGLTDGNFHGFSMYSSPDMATWKNEGLVLPMQSSGLLGPNRKGERPHIIKCPATGEFVLYAHAADLSYNADKEVVYATASKVTGPYQFKGALLDARGSMARQGDMGTFTDDDQAYVVGDGGSVYKLAKDCHTWVSRNTYSELLGPSDASEAPTVFRAGNTYYWLASNKSGWRTNNNFYFTAPAMTGPWTYRGYLASVTNESNNQSPERTWLSQTTWVMPITGCSGTTYVYWGDHWDGQDTPKPGPGLHNDLAGYVFQPLVFTGTAIFMPTYHETWKLNVGAGTWGP